MILPPPSSLYYNTPLFSLQVPINIGFRRRLIFDRTWSKAVQQTPESDSHRTVTHPKKKSRLRRFIGSTIGGTTKVLRKKHRGDILVSKNLKAEDTIECLAAEITLQHHPTHRRQQPRRSNLEVSRHNQIKRHRLPFLRCRRTGLSLKAQQNL